MLSDFLTDNESLTDQLSEVRSPILKVRGKTLIFGNVVYQIHNISSIGLINRTTIKKFPKLLLFLLAIGVVFLFVTNWQIKALGAIIVAFFLWMVYRYNKNKIKGRYGLTIYTNAGSKVVFTSKSEDYIKKVILVLYKIMNNDELNAVSFNFETLSIDQSQAVEIGTNIGSPFFGARVNGDIVNEV
ncbi:MAG: DUF6232 family protein [Coleofasciculaceae cyanobacterium]